MNKSFRPASVCLDRRALLKGAAAGALVAASGGHRVWAQAATTPTIPEVTIRLGGFAVTNHGWTVLMSESGFLKDVGITMAGGAPKLLRETQVLPQVNQGELDIATMWFGMVTQALDKETAIRPILSYSYFQGNTILASPESGFKSVDEFVSEGMAWDEAAAAAVQQMRGKRFAITASPSTYPWNDFALSLGGMSMKDTQTFPVEDPRAVQMAIGGRVDFAAPGGAVQVYQLQYQAGWKPIISTRQMVKYMPSGKGSAVNELLNYDLMICTDSFLEQNRETVYRWCGATYRTLEYIFGDTQQQALTRYAPFISANTGSQMTPETIKFIFEQLDPFFRWKDQASIWQDEQNTLYFKNIYTYQIGKFVAAGTIPDQPYDLDRIFASATIWREMKEMQEKTEAILAKLDASASEDRQRLAVQAKLHYDGFNFYDALRFAEAATA